MPRNRRMCRPSSIFTGPAISSRFFAQSTPQGSIERTLALELLLGGQPDTQPELVKLASPVFQVDPTAPPLLLEHGDQDLQMPINQAHELQGAYEKLGLPVVFKVMHGSGHGGPAFNDDANLNLIDAFLRKHLDLANDAVPDVAQANVEDV